MLKDVLENVLCRTNNTLKCVVVSAEKGVTDNPAVEGVYKVIKQQALTVGKKVVQEVAPEAEIPIKKAAEVATKAVQNTIEVIMDPGDAASILEEMLKAVGGK